MILCTLRQTDSLRSCSCRIHCHNFQTLCHSQYIAQLLESELAEVLEQVLELEPERALWSLNSCWHTAERMQKMPMLGLTGTNPCSLSNFHQGNSWRNEAQETHPEQMSLSLQR
jgi:hypothetical protein